MKNKLNNLTVFRAIFSEGNLRNRLTVSKREVDGQETVGVLPWQL